MKYVVSILFFFVPLLLFAGYSPEREVQKFMDSHDITSQYLQNLSLTRKDFLSILAKRYPEYIANKGGTVDYTSAKPLDVIKKFRDMDMQSDIGLALMYFASKGIFDTVEYFHPENTFTQEQFFIVMRRLGIFSSMQQCINLHICDKETTTRSPFDKGMYLTYVVRILNTKLRKIWTHPDQYIQNNYKPYLSSDFAFPLKGQTLNGCYGFALRNILMYKFGIGVRVAAVEQYIGKKPEELSNDTLQQKMDIVLHVYKEKKFHIQTLFTYLQHGEPLAVSYMFSYTDKFGAQKQVAHVVAAYSFDEVGVRIAETVTNRRIRVPYEEIFDINGYAKQKWMRAVYYNPKKYRTDVEVILEKEYNFLVGEF